MCNEWSFAEQLSNRPLQCLNIGVRGVGVGVEFRLEGLQVGCDELELLRVLVNSWEKVLQTLLEDGKASL